MEYYDSTDVNVKISIPTTYTSSILLDGEPVGLIVYEIIRPAGLGES